MRSLSIMEGFDEHKLETYMSLNCLPCVFHALFGEGVASFPLFPPKRLNKESLQRISRTLFALCIKLFRPVV